MTVEELIAALRQANPLATVEVCVGNDYYGIDPEFTGDDGSGSVFVIESAEKKAER